MKRRMVFGGALCVLLVLIDRLTKAWAAGALRALPGGRMDVFPGIVGFRYAENTGAAFGMLSGMRLLNALLTLILLAVLAVFLWRMRREKGFVISGAIVMAGGLSHLYDRLLGRNIIDFIELEFIRFPIFNVADICICAGAVWLAAAYLLYENKTRSDRA